MINLTPWHFTSKGWKQNPRLLLHTQAEFLSVGGLAVRKKTYQHVGDICPSAEVVFCAQAWQIVADMVGHTTFDRTW